MQDTEGKPIKLNGKPAEFTAKDFTTMNFATAEDKGKSANKFTKFLLGGFQRTSFKKEINKQLHHMFGDTPLPLKWRGFSCYSRATCSVPKRLRNATDCDTFECGRKKKGYGASTLESSP